MPANKKYLTTSSWQRFAKISAGIVGGYIISALLHIALAFWLPNPKMVLITSVYTLYMLWVAIIILSFLAKNGWKLWALYVAIILVFSVLIHFGKLYNPVN
ncbi:hypothetical protein [Marixanthomonas spongiae]|uniref:Uncharacterized protein n=1 Tax=Marixanthomonas spongiae TaxID=2174845 RepID=A0A2U0I3M6_9FLAO|nr:hypothetical protein [Marixanthomonas spongiae]PVW15590.1 hypothetical protein DDV96_04790 [Marixanthomonas spongiae]